MEMMFKRQKDNFDLRTKQSTRLLVKIHNMHVRKNGGSCLSPYYCCLSLYLFMCCIYAKVIKETEKKIALPPPDMTRTEDILIGGLLLYFFSNTSGVRWLLFWVGVDGKICLVLIRLTNTICLRVWWKVPQIWMSMASMSLDSIVHLSTAVLYV